MPVEKKPEDRRIPVQVVYEIQSPPLRSFRSETHRVVKIRYDYDKQEEAEQSISIPVARAPAFTFENILRAREKVYDEHYQEYQKLRVDSFNPRREKPDYRISEVSNGFLIAIKDDSNQIRGCVFGTKHRFDYEYKHYLADHILQALISSSHLFFEIKPPSSKYSKAIFFGAEQRLEQTWQTAYKPQQILGLEDIDKQIALLKNLQNIKAEGSLPDIEMDEAFYTTGDYTKLQEYRDAILAFFESVYDKQTPEVQKAIDTFIHGRDEGFVAKIIENFTQSDDSPREVAKPFYAVGAMHLPGIVNGIRRCIAESDALKGWKLEPIQPPLKTLILSSTIASKFAKSIEDAEKSRSWQERTGQPLALMTI